MNLSGRCLAYSSLPLLTKVFLLVVWLPSVPFPIVMLCDFRIGSSDHLFWSVCRTMVQDYYLVADASTYVRVLFARTEKAKFRGHHRLIIIILYMLLSISCLVRV